MSGEGLDEKSRYFQFLHFFKNQRSLVEEFQCDLDDPKAHFSSDLTFWKSEGILIAKG